MYNTVLYRLRWFDYEIRGSTIRVGVMMMSKKSMYGEQEGVWVLGLYKNC